VKWNSSKLNKCFIIFVFSLLSLEIKAVEKTVKELKEKRQKTWKDYLKQGAYSLFIEKDKGLSHLPYHEQQKILNKRNIKWDKLLEYYAEADYDSVTKNAPSFYKWGSHRAAAAYLSGLSFAKFNELKKSLKDLNRSISYKFKNPQVYFEKGKVLLSLDLLEKSFEAFQESIKRKNKKTMSTYYL